MTESTQTPQADPRLSFLEGMSRAATTVSIVTTDGAAGRAGVTVSAMTSVSADGDAPTLLVCVHHLSPAAATIIGNGCFVVNVLRDDQSFISDTFAGRRPAPGGDKFACTDWTPMQSGAPRVASPLVAFDCRVLSAERLGTHHIFIGEVVGTFLPESGSPLVYANRTYGAAVRLAPLGPARPASSRLRVGTLATFGPYLLPPLLRALQEVEGPVDLELEEGDQRQILELLQAGAIDVAFLYDFDIGPDIARQTVAMLAPYVLLPASHPLAERAEITLADLLPHPMVLLDAPPSRDYFLSLFEGSGTPDVRYRARSFEMVRGMVAHGLGYSLLATKPAAAMSYDGKALADRPLAGRHKPSRMVICTRAGAALPRQAETFLLHCANLFDIRTE